MKKSVKIILGITFALALTPVFLPWADLNSVVSYWGGIRVMGPVFYIGVVAYYASVYFGNRWNMVGAQLFTLVDYFLGIANFTRRTNISYDQEWVFTLNVLNLEVILLAVGAILVHIALTLWLTRKREETI